MGRDDIIRMAREASHTYVVIRAYPANSSFTFDEDGLKRFAALVAAAEREACANLCNAIQAGNEDNGKWLWEARNCAVAIRARGTP